MILRLITFCILPIFSLLKKQIFVDQVSKLNSSVCFCSRYKKWNWLNNTLCVIPFGAGTIGNCDTGFVLSGQSVDVGRRYGRVIGPDQTSVNQAFHRSGQLDGGGHFRVSWAGDQLDHGWTDVACGCWTDVQFGRLYVLYRAGRNLWGRPDMYGWKKEKSQHSFITWTKSYNT